MKTWKNRTINAMLATTMLLAATADPAAAEGSKPSNTAAIVRQALLMAPKASVAPQGIVTPERPTVGTTLEQGITIKAGDMTLRLSIPGANERFAPEKGLDPEILSSTRHAIITEPGTAQVFTILNSQYDATIRYNVNLPKNITLAPEPDGGFDLVDVSESFGMVSYGRIDAPWAIDAKGKKLPSAYHLEGSQLVQQVDLTGAAFPVVADPRVSFGWWMYVRWSKQEVQNLGADVPIAVVAAILAWACRYIPYKWGIVACLAGVAGVSTAIARTFRLAAREHKCVEVKFDYLGDQIPGGWKRYTC